MFKEGSDPDVYRDTLAEELKEASKEERKEILEQAKETPEYQIARSKKIEKRQEEEEIDDGLGVFIKHKTLYHGSARPGLKEEGFKILEDNNCTIGDGIYFTSQAKDAAGYAKGRTGQGRSGLKSKDECPIIYECSVENMKLLDLRNDDNVRKILPGWRKKLKELLDDPVVQRRTLESTIWEAVDGIDSGQVNSNNLQRAINSWSPQFTEYVRGLNYDGLVSLEGGEVGYVGDHDSYVIFDPEKVKIVKEQKIQKEKKEINV